MFTLLSYHKTCLMEKVFLRQNLVTFAYLERRCSDVDPTLYTLGYHKQHCCQNCCYINSYFLYAGMTRFRLYCFASYYDAALICI